MAEEWRINMQSLIDELKDEYGYSSYDIAMVKYVLTSIFYEFSKLIIFGIFFGFLGYFKSFLVSLILLLFLRINIGGIHCKHYITCFLLTFVVLFSYTTSQTFICSTYINNFHMYNMYDYQL